MYDYQITPKSPLLFRDGKPFGSTGERAETLPFPLPSTIAGALRTIRGDDQTLDFNTQAETLLKMPVIGPLLTQRDSNEICKVLIPTPADSVCLNDKEGQPTIFRLRPDRISNTEGIDLPEASAPLLPLFLTTECKGKPVKDAPCFWPIERLNQWLMDDHQDRLSTTGMGISSLPQEIRTHVAMDNSTLTNKKGMLYQTTGLDFLEPHKEDGNHGWHDHSFGLLARCPEKLSTTYRKFGGEARLAHVERAENLWPKCPSDLKSKLATTEGVRLMLATPAIFKHGWKPGWLDENLEGTPPRINGIKLRLRAAAVPRWQAVSGWSMATIGGKPAGARPVRRMAPAGSVYWFQVIEGCATALASLWLTSISDQQHLDGFGLALPGIWSDPLK